MVPFLETVKDEARGKDKKRKERKGNGGKKGDREGGKKEGREGLDKKIVLWGWGCRLVVECSGFYPYPFATHTPP